VVFETVHSGRKAKVVLAVLAVLVGITGCSKSPQRSQTLIVAIDRSGSTDGFRAQQLDQMDTITTAAIADNCALEVWSFDSTPTSLWGPRVPDSSHVLDTVKQKEFHPDHAAVRHVTRPALLLEAIEQHVQLNHLAQPNILILTDGDSEMPSDAGRFTAGAQTLAHLPGVRVTVIGISPENRKVWENAFTPLLSSRFQMAGQSEADTLLNSCLR
jgi:hypothetical protein